MATMRNYGPGQHPKVLIHSLSENLLTRFNAAPLLDGYDAYQHIMTYWSEVMQDDAYQLTSEGWAAAKVMREIIKVKDGDKMVWPEPPDMILKAGRGQRGFVAEVVPPTLIVARFFAKEKAALDALEAAVEDVERRMTELDEEHSGEDGLLAESRNGKGKVSAALLKARRKELATELDAGFFKRYDKAEKAGNAHAQFKAEFVETIPEFLEMFAIDDMLRLIEEQSEKASAAKEAKARLDAQTVAKYPKLTDEEVKALVVEDKWIASIKAALNGERDRIAQALTGRIQTLVERYAEPLPTIMQRVERLDAKVAGRLKAMGFV